MKNIDYHKKILEELPISYKRWFEGENKFLHKVITKNSKVLEVGCGDGRSLKDILDITNNITGIDHDSEAVKEAKTNFKEYSKVKILKAEGKDIPFNNNYFDFVICMTSFANFGENKLVILNEMKRVLKKEGKIIISVFSEDALNERLKMYKKINLPVKEIKGNKVIFDKSFQDNISEQFSEKELKEIFNKANLKINEIKKEGIGYICSLIK